KISDIASSLGLARSPKIAAMENQHDGKWEQRRICIEIAPAKRSANPPNARVRDRQAALNLSSSRHRRPRPKRGIRMERWK
ncbi:hypothetical protein, partial [uncultured Rhodoblastus sp.]|uniref:hypothetical protein n=1 Tax=uncultured Rhodoblastus sp. TaxID=543037 RepID=UPI0025FCC4FA